MLESQPGAGDGVATGLQEQGHHTTACHEQGAAAFPCSGMDGEHCPIDTSTIDVAVAVESAGSTDAELAGGLQGTRCALRRFIPVVVVDPAETSPLAEWATAVSPSAEPGAVGAAVEAAAAAPLPRHTQIATDALRATLELHGFPSDQASATVTRSGNEFNAVLVPGVDLDVRTTEVASIRVLAGIHELDKSASRTNVTVE